MNTATPAGPSPDLLAALRSAWDRDGCVLTPPASRPAAEPSTTTGTPQAAPQAARRDATPPAARIGRCRVHLPPFDAVERSDPRRPGWVRLTCRTCGGFLGYSPGNRHATLGDHG